MRQEQRPMQAETKKARAYASLDSWQETLQSLAATGNIHFCAATIYPMDHDIQAIGLRTRIVEICGNATAIVAWIIGISRVRDTTLAFSFSIHYLLLLASLVLYRGWINLSIGIILNPNFWIRVKQTAATASRSHRSLHYRARKKKSLF